MAKSQNDVSSEQPSYSQTTSPGGQFVSQEEREGFVNHPHIMMETEKAESLDIRGMASNLISQGREYGSKYAGQVYDRAREIPGMSREVASRIDASAHEKPWMHVGIVGVTGLAVGFLLGRALFSSSND